MKRRQFFQIFGAFSFLGIISGSLFKHWRTMQNKKLHKIIAPREQHWVGDGFFVSTLFSVHSEDYRLISPFVMLDHARSRHFPPTDKKLGVGEHPHRGFETVTFAIQGEISHRDSGGGGGIISSGGVQWMTAGSGVVHEEFHSREFALRGGDFEMVQLWVNLPAQNKMIRPRYQSINNEDFPKIELSNGKARAKVVSGTLATTTGPAKTYTPINIYEIDATEVCELELELPPGTNTLVLQLRGEGQIGEDQLKLGQMAIFEREGELLSLRLDPGAKVLVLNGEPIEEPVVSYGPFVMNTKAEIIQAIEDFQSGKMGQLVRESDQS
jgi:quercetin 2,3-dioxygenase